MTNPRNVVSVGMISEVALGLVMEYIDDPRDRDAISLVCRHWCRLDASTRKHVTISMSYSTTPARLLRRFPCLESLKLKSKPRASMFNLIPDDWGGSSTPWISEISSSFHFLKALHLRRMIVSDHDIAVLVGAKSHILNSLKLDRCSGFSTQGLAHVARFCKKLETLFVEDSIIANEKDGRWVHELAVNNPVLETLNFHLTELAVVPADLILLVRNCRSLKCLKISECDLSDLVEVFHASASLQEFAGGSFNNQQGNANRYDNFYFPPSLQCLGLLDMGTNEIQVLFPYGSALKKLDLQFALLGTVDHCEIVQRCPNLEILEARDVIGDMGLQVVAQNCKKLRRLRVERGQDDNGAIEDELGKVSQVGLMAVAQGCPELDHFAVHVNDITNGALESIGTFGKNLLDFRLVLLEREARITELPLDNGVRDLLRGCSKLRRFALYVRPGGLSDVGLGYIGEHATNVRYMLLGNVGQSDFGLLQFSRGCRYLQKLELRSCNFSERALALAAMQLKSLRYLWVQGYNASVTGSDLMAMARPFWNIEFIPPRHEPNNGGEDNTESPAQILAYYSHAGKRSDCPSSIISLYPA